jgi:hypothetical protein
MSGWLKLPIFDCRLPIDSGTIRYTAFSMDNRHSPIAKHGIDDFRLSIAD